MSTHVCETLGTCLQESQEFIRMRVCEYASESGYASWTSMHQEAWEITIDGMIRSISDAIADGHYPSHLRADEISQNNPAIKFAIKESRLYRGQGVALALFMGLIKCFRKTLSDAIDQTDRLSREISDEWHQWLVTIFDRIEIAVCSEWINVDADRYTEELQQTNLQLTHEKESVQNDF